MNNFSPRAINRIGSTNKTGDTQEDSCFLMESSQLHSDNSYPLLPPRTDGQLLQFQVHTILKHKCVQNYSIYTKGLKFNVDKRSQSHCAIQKVR